MAFWRVMIICWINPKVKCALWNQGFQDILVCNGADSSHINILSWYSCDGIHSMMIFMGRRSWHSFIHSFSSTHHRPNDTISPSQQWYTEAKFTQQSTIWHRLKRICYYLKIIAATGQIIIMSGRGWVTICMYV